MHTDFEEKNNGLKIDPEKIERARRLFRLLDNINTSPAERFLTS